MSDTVKEYACCSLCLEPITGVPVCMPCANGIRPERATGGIVTPSTPTAVTVSDRMRGLIEQLVHASGAAAVHPENPEIEKALDIIWNRVKFEVGWKETVIDQRGKRIQELEGMLVEDARKALAESPTAEREIWCPNDEPCSPDCEHCAQLLSQTAPADETRVKCMNCLDTGYMRNQDMPGHTIPCTQDCAAAAPPQTRGEAMPEVVQRAIESLQKRLASDDDEVWGTLETAANWLAKDRSRLLTALEEEQQEKDKAYVEAERAEDARSRMAALGIEYRKRICTLEDQVKSLQSAAVLQKEELERYQRMNEDAAYENRTRD